MERTLADLDYAAGLAARQFAGRADAEQIKSLQRQACSSFLEDFALWQDMGQRNILIAVDRPKAKEAALRQRECRSPRGRSTVVGIR